MIRRKARLLYVASSIVVLAAGIVGLDTASGAPPPPAATLSAGGTTFTAGTSAGLGWTSIPNPTTKDWVGLYPSSGAADTAFVKFRYTEGTVAMAFEPFLIPFGTTPGTTYEFRLFSNDSFTRLATSPAFNVT